MLEGFDFTVSSVPMDEILSLHIVIVIASTEGLIIFTLYISNAFRNTIIPNTIETVHLSLPHIYLQWFK